MSEDVAKYGAMIEQLAEGPVEDMMDGRKLEAGGSSSDGGSDSDGTAVPYPISGAW